MKHALPPLTNDLIDAFAASAGAWLLRLVGVIARLGPLSRSRRLHRLVAQLERSVEAILFLRAVHRSRLGEAEASLRRSLVGPRARPRHIPRAAPAGFRRSTNQRLALFFRNSGVRARKACLASRLSQLAAALASPARHIAYFFKRLLKGLRPRRLVPTAPAAHALGGHAPRVPFIDDSS